MQKIRCQRMRYLKQSIGGNTNIDNHVVLDRKVCLSQLQSLSVFGNLLPETKTIEKLFFFKCHNDRNIPLLSYETKKAPVTGIKLHIHLYKFQM